MKADNDSIMLAHKIMSKHKGEYKDEIKAMLEFAEVWQGIKVREEEAKRVGEILEELRRHRATHKQGSELYFEYIHICDKLAILESHIINEI